MRLNIWEALDKYKSEYAKDTSWSSTAVTVDKKTNRLVMYYLGDKEVVAEIKGKKLEDGSCDVQSVLSYVDHLRMVFTMNNRNGVLDVYRCDGIFEDMPLPFPIHMERFVEAIADLVGYTEEPSKVQGWNLGLTGGASGSDAGVDGRSEPVKEGTKWDMTEAAPSKYTARDVRKTAMKSFYDSETYKSRKKSRDSVDVNALIPKEFVTSERCVPHEDIEAKLSMLEARSDAVEKPRTLGIIGLIADLLDGMEKKDG